MIFAESKCIISICTWIELYLKRLKHQVPDSTKLAIVFDIDETIYFPCQCQHVSPPPQIKRIYDQSVAYGFQIYFITSRIYSQHNVDQTWHLLKRLGCNDFRGLFLMPENYLQYPNASSFKTLLRESICKEGYHIALNIGNRWQDLMLLPPFEIDEEAHAARKLMLERSHNTFMIVKLPDVAWISVKMPTSGCCPWYE